LGLVLGEIRLKQQEEGLGQKFSKETGFNQGNFDFLPFKIPLKAPHRKKRGVWKHTRVFIL